jgi:hypothetical protein
MELPRQKRDAIRHRARNPAGRIANNGSQGRDCGGSEREEMIPDTFQYSFEKPTVEVWVVLAFVVITLVVWAFSRKRD